jgi:CheY-like chemotaxis protein
MNTIFYFESISGSDVSAETLGATLRRAQGGALVERGDMVDALLGRHQSCGKPGSMPIGSNNTDPALNAAPVAHSDAFTSVVAAAVMRSAVVAAASPKESAVRESGPITETRKSTPCSVIATPDTSSPLPIESTNESAMPELPIVPATPGRLSRVLPFALPTVSPTSVVKSVGNVTGDVSPVPVSWTPPAGDNAMRILIVDDLKFNQKALVLQLTSKAERLALHVHFECVDDGAQAVDRVFTVLTPYHLIWMDLQMPVMDGITAIRTIRAREAELGVRHYIVAITANNLQGDQDAAIAAGADQFIAKPARPQQLLSVLETVRAAHATLAAPPTEEGGDAMVGVDSLAVSVHIVGSNSSGAI